MSGSSPAHSSISTTAIAGERNGVGGGGGGLSTDDFYFPADLVSVQDRKDDAMLVLKANLMAALNKEVKSMDEDSWMFEGPPSCINQISGQGGFLQKRLGVSKNWNLTGPR